MRRILSFSCEGATLAATLDDAPGATGLLIVSGGNEIRIGAHRGMAKLAADIAAAGYPVFRFDRRGIGDSEGFNSEFEGSSADIYAALAAFRRECPGVQNFTAFGNCDAASALVLHTIAVDRLILANPWVIEAQAGMPPPAAIKARYMERLRDPKAWLGMMTGAINVRKLVSGVAAIIRPQTPSSLSGRFADQLEISSIPTTILLASRDGTAIAFADQWDKPLFAGARSRHDVTIEKIDSASHSFASKEDYAALKTVILNQCAAKSA
jgi:exosortase A-associated hydrolase 1